MVSEKWNELQSGTQLGIISSALRSVLDTERNSGLKPKQITFSLLDVLIIVVVLSKNTRETVFA